MIEGIHERWTVLLNNLTGEQYGKNFIHPEHFTKLSELTVLEFMLGTNHHLVLT
jgi:hypothetical protein